MEILKIAGIILLGLMLALTLKIRDVRFASIVSIVTFLIVMIWMIDVVRPIVELGNIFASKIYGNHNILSLVLKTAGISLISYTVSIICNESGEKTLGNTMEIAADIICILLALPLIQNVFDSLLEILNV